ncbi:MAG: ATP-binding protein, partial [Flavobacteriales bacterium]|nr:ATP-binding protein [Flavobacteriales bacterium]
IVDDRDGTIEDSYNADASTAYIDRMHITNVFLNLLDNANKYSPEKPHIEVRTYNPSPDVWAIDVKDHGMGMSHNDAKKIFDNFYRIPTGDIHNIKGHGLGLAYSKKIIEMHGGSISVVSSLGKGSTFTIKLPLDRKEENN